MATVTRSTILIISYANCFKISHTVLKISRKSLFAVYGCRSYSGKMVIVPTAHTLWPQYCRVRVLKQVAGLVLEFTSLSQRWRCNRCAMLRERVVVTVGRGAADQVCVCLLRVWGCCHFGNTTAHIAAITTAEKMFFCNMQLLQITDCHPCIRSSRWDRRNAIGLCVSLEWSVCV